MRSVLQKRVRTTSTNQPAANAERVEGQEVVTRRGLSEHSELAKIVRVIYGVILGVLALAFIFRLAGANGDNGFVSFIYSISNILSAPFDGIFNVSRVNNGTFTSVFDWSLIVAAGVYGLIAWAILNFADREA